MICWIILPLETLLNVALTNLFAKLLVYGVQFGCLTLLGLSSLDLDHSNMDVGVIDEFAVVVFDSR